MAYELKTEKFAGPLEKLLELIEDRKMEISEISLAEVTDDFLNYLRSLEKIEVPILADFIVVASRLVLLKSKSLLPGLELSEQEEEDVRDLELRLKIYKEFKPLMKVLANRWKSREWEYSRPYFLEGGLGASIFSSSMEDIFFPGNNLSIDAIVESLAGIVKSFGSLKIETETIREKVVTLEEKIREIIDRLQKEVTGSFGKMVEQKSRSEMIIIFLAILHLARERLVQLEQKDHFSDIIINKV